MKFIEMLQPSKGSLGFIVQQGFSESSQSYYLEAYLERMTQRLQRDYLGTVIKGGVEGFQLQPVEEQEKILAPFVELVGSVLQSGQMSPPILAKLAGQGYLSKGMLFLFRLLAPTGLVHAYWNRQLKQNNAFHWRSEKPYAAPKDDRFIKTPSGKRIFLRSSHQQKAGRILVMEHGQGQRAT